MNGTKVGRVVVVGWLELGMFVFCAEGALPVGLSDALGLEWVLSTALKLLVAVFPEVEPAFCSKLMLLKRALFPGVALQEAMSPTILIKA